MNYLRSFRDYIDGLRAIGELQEINAEVDWNLEIGAITRRCYELGAPAPLFNTIKGIEPGFRVIGAPAGISRQPGLYLSRCALSLGFPPTATGQELVEALALARERAPIPPRTVPSGPCKENKLVDEAVDLLRFPTPLIHDGDGGRYIGTYGTIVAQTPDKRWTNWSIARAMLLDKNRMTGVVHPLQHIGMIHKMWRDQGCPMPFALALGVPPVISFVSSAEIPPLVNEADYIGGYLGEPVEVTRCETFDLCVPATSEIVIEGTLSADETAIEGPMGEYAGYLWSGAGHYQPVYNVSAITYRHDPILPVVAAGEPVEEDHTVHGIMGAAEVLWQLRQAHIPVTMVWTVLESAEHWLVVTVPPDWRKRLPCTNDELMKRIANNVLESKFGLMIPKILVVNDDVDPTNTKEVVWALATRCHPGRGELVFAGESTNPLVAFLSTAEKRSLNTSKSVYNCLPQEEFGDVMPTRSSFAHGYPAELQNKILAKWREYGFRD